jgi:hypothetical protein
MPSRLRSTGSGLLDVVVNSAGNFNAGFFEEITPEDFRAPDRDNLVRTRQRR